MKLEWSASALADLDRFAEFLNERDPRLVGAVAGKIREQARIIEANPQLGRQMRGRANGREISPRVERGLCVSIRL